MQGDNERRYPTDSEVVRSTPIEVKYLPLIASTEAECNAARELHCNGCKEVQYAPLFLLYDPRQKNKDEGYDSEGDEVEWCEDYFAVALGCHAHRCIVPGCTSAPVTDGNVCLQHMVSYCRFGRAARAFFYAGGEALMMVHNWIDVRKGRGADYALCTNKNERLRNGRVVSLVCNEKHRCESTDHRSGFRCCNVKELPKQSNPEHVQRDLDLPKEDAARKLKQCHFHRAKSGQAKPEPMKKGRVRGYW